MNSPVKERPILFSGPMVRAILEGRKTQTRRVVKRPFVGADGTPHAAWEAVFDKSPDGIKEWRWRIKGAQNSASPIGSCPYGQPGDRLWVRETWQSNGLNWGKPISEMSGGLGPVHYQATDKGEWKTYWGSWKPSIRMPRWASRILLEVVSVRVERLQDISAADAKAEGAKQWPELPIGRLSTNDWCMEQPASRDECLGNAQMAFANYFCKINGHPPKGQHDPRPWNANPWVWVVEFKRVCV